MNHISIDQNPYKNPVRKWLASRYGTEQAEIIWNRTVKNYKAYLTNLPDLGGKKSGHASAIYGGLSREQIEAMAPAFFCEPGNLITLHFTFDE